MKLLVDKKQSLKNLNSSLVWGFTLIEILTTMGIVILVTLFIGYFLRSVLNFKALFGGEIIVQQEIQQTIQTIIPEVRSMQISALGSYPIIEASSGSFTFYSDIDGDDVVKQVTYFTSSTILKKRIIEPSGNPPVYNPADEIITEMVHNLDMGTSSVFSYYDQNYTGSEPAMSYPINILSIRGVGIKISVKDADSSASEEVSIKISPRNLRTNL